MPFTVVQAAPTVESPSLTTAAVTLPQPTGAGNTLVACITTSATSANPQVSGITLGGSADHWQAAATDPGTTKFGGAIWYDPGCGGGQTAVVVTCTGGSGASIEIYVAVYEVATAGLLIADRGSHGDAASGAITWSSGTTGTTGAPSEIFFGVAMATSAIPVVTGAGTWTTQQTGAGIFDQVAGYQIVSAVGTAEFAGTQPPGGYIALVATFRAAAAAARSAAAITAATASAAAVTDPRDGTRQLTAATTSAPSVT